MSEVITLLESDLEVGVYHPEPPSNWVHKEPHGIRIIHKPTGLVVRCHEHKSAFANRAAAVKELDGRVKAYKNGIANTAKKGGDEMQEPESKFWVVWREGGQAPRVKHPTEAEATEEAVRLTNSAVGCHFYVLEAKSMHTAVSTVISRALENTQNA
jgi:hypothetical protein